MTLPNQPVTLSVEQIAQLNQQLSKLRHDINNHLSLIMAALELIRQKPEMKERMMTTIAEQPPKIGAVVTQFSAEFEKTFGIKRS